MAHTEMRMTTVWTRDTKRRRVLSVLNISDSKRKSVLSLKTEETLEREEEGKEERVTHGAHPRS
jgi:hypothetical protein